MMRLSTVNYQKIQQSQSFNIHYGGAEANVAVSLSHFNEPVKYITRLPLNELGESGIMELRAHGVNTKAIKRGGERIGSYFLEVGTGHRGSTVIYDRENSGFSSFESHMINWEEELKEATWFHWSGISPAVSEQAAVNTLAALKAAKKLGVTVSCDLNYRSKLWKWGKPALEVMPKLIQYTDIILGGKSDAEIMLGVKFKENDHYDSAPQRIFETFPHLKYVATSLRESFSASHNKLSAILFNGTESFQSPKYDMPNMVDRVGGGDALMAGLIYGLIHFPNKLQDVIDFAISASVIKHTIPGDANISSINDVYAIMKGKDAGLVSR